MIIMGFLEHGMGTPKQKIFLVSGISNILTFAFVIPHFYFLAGLFIGQRHFIFIVLQKVGRKVWLCKITGPLSLWAL
tara:strand:+ start:103 stop:333 length:231 start_codon:yes stop_codon:yes gene_type:complete